jgi:hypothetical protein
MIKDPMIKIRNERFRDIRAKVFHVVELVSMDALATPQIDEAYTHLDNLIETSHLDGIITDKQANELNEWLGKIEPHTS